MVKIAFFEVEKWEENYLRKRLAGHKVVFSNKKLTPATVGLAKGCPVVSTFVFSQVDEKTLSALPKLKLLTTMSTGFDHIDLKACARRRITVCNVPAYGENTVAEHTFALILAISRKLVPSVERTRKGEFSRDGLRGFELHGKTLGLIGTGKIGCAVARIARGFNMKVIAFDIFQNQELQENLGVEYVKTLDELFKKSDIISLHVPLKNGNKHLINKNSISKMKKGVILINTARGGLVDTDALIQALNKRVISYAGLDVLEEECFIKEETELLAKSKHRKCDLKAIEENHILASKQNVLITPHNAFNSVEALERILDTTAENINSFAKGRPVNVVKA